MKRNTLIFSVFIFLFLFIAVVHAADSGTTSTTNQIATKAKDISDKNLNLNPGRWIILGQTSDKSEYCKNITDEEYQNVYPNLKWYKYEAECKAAVVSRSSTSTIGGVLIDISNKITEKVRLLIGGFAHDSNGNVYGWAREDVLVYYGIAAGAFAWICLFALLGNFIKDLKNSVTVKTFFYFKEEFSWIKTLVSFGIFVLLFGLLTSIPIIVRIVQILTLLLVLQGKWLLQSFVLAFEVVFVPEVFKLIFAYSKRKKEYEEDLKKYVGEEVAKTMAGA